MQETTMFKIAVCDDDPIQHEQIRRILREHPKASAFSLSFYMTCESLAFCLEEGKVFDLIILDIEFPGGSGLRISELLRQTMNDNLTQILFISSHRSYAMELFQYRPLNFLEKPVTQDRLFSAIDRAMQLMEDEGQCFVISIGRSIHRIPLREIRYFESRDKQVVIHAAKQDYIYYERLKRITAPPDFIRIHKSFLVNSNHVQQYCYDSLTLGDGTVLPISRPHRQQVRDELLARFRFD